jgi:hypothetical protein
MDKLILALHSSGDRAPINACYIPYSKAYNKWLHPSKDDVIELMSSFIKSRHLHSHQFDWSVIYNNKVIYEMIHNPKSIPEDLFD